MDARTFLENFATIAEAPGGVQRLRDLVLDLAVRGQVVEQLPSDEPASQLLHRITEVRRRLVDDGVLGRPKRPPTISFEDETLPDGWALTPLSSAVTWDLTDGDWVESKDQDPSGEIRLIQLADVGVGDFKDKSARYLTQETAERLNCTPLEPGDVLIARLPNPLGRACVFPALEQACVTVVDVAIARCSPVGIDPAYLALFMNSPAMRSRIETVAAGTTRKRVSTGNLRALPIPVPPLAEQERIVAKVDELMGFCDDLEARQESRHRATTRFRASALHALTEAQPPEQLRLAWQRVESNWSTMTAASDSIGELRQAILQLAFEGRLAGAGAHGRPRSESTPSILDGPFPIPGHWRWARFEEVVDSRLGKMLDKAKNTGPLRPYLRNANVQWFRFDLSEIHELRLEDSDLETHTLRLGDLVICEGGEPGRLAVCDDNVSGMAFQKALHRARPRSDVDVWYLAFLLRCYAGSGYLSTFFTGATIKHLTGKALASVPVPVPPIEEQRRIVVRIEELVAACDQLEATTSRCAAIQAAAAAGLTRAT